jgi:hypothetical protein
VTTGTQTVAIVEGRQPRRVRKLWLFLLLVLPLTWHIGRREWDFQAAYSGVVVEKGMDYSLIFGGRDPDLYIVLQDDLGKRSKRYICSSNCSSTQLKVWSNIAVGTFVVKDKGYPELPYRPGEKLAAQPAFNSSTHNWIFAGIITVCAAAVFITLRQLWQAL